MPGLLRSSIPDPGHAKPRLDAEAKAKLEASETTLAGAGGFEPPHGGTKIRCLTAWLRPIGGHATGLIGAAAGCVKVGRDTPRSPPRAVKPFIPPTVPALAARAPASPQRGCSLRPSQPQ